MNRQVTVIPAVIPQFVNKKTLIRKKRVAAHARVSTDFEEQQSSYEAQVDYYTRHIQSNENWEFVKVYSDEGISATSTKRRDGFNRMITDAMDGKIDLIITKSVSRFARNTVDTLTTVRKLKDKGVEVYFEKEGIYTLDSKGELLITIMSSLAQEESRSISENVTWGVRKRFADGKVSLPYKHFLGYKKGENCLPEIVEKEAETVRLIYSMFLEGKTAGTIARYLINMGIPTPTGKQSWNPATIKNILKSEKYKGSAILQKTYTTDFLTKKKKVNEGEIQKFYVENSHPAIVSPDVYDMVQYEFQKRKSAKGYMTGNSPFSGKIVCGQCGGFYGSKVWHSTSKYRKVIWQCNHKFTNQEKCKTPHLYEEDIKKAFVKAFNDIIVNKNKILREYEEILEKLTDTKALDREDDKLREELETVTVLLRSCVDENARSALNQAEYTQKYSELKDRFDKVQTDIAAVSNKRMEYAAKRQAIAGFIQSLQKQEGLLTGFDEELWN
ncbi:MAG: recombinase family protein, partial [Bacillota bacterium]|nr:recombinase family protein [Bacillota bacterium]